MSENIFFIAAIMSLTACFIIYIVPRIGYLISKPIIWFIFALAYIFMLPSIIYDLFKEEEEVQTDKSDRK